MNFFWSKELVLSSANIDTTPVRFDYTGTIQEYKVPLGVKKLLVDCVAARGKQPTGKYFGNKYNAGRGGRVECVLDVKSRQVLRIWVAKEPADIKIAEYNASDIRTSNAGVLTEEGLNSRLIVAGGGGSGAENNWSGWEAGQGGGLVGGSTLDSYGLSTGGTQTAGGYNNNYASPYGSSPGKPGKFGLGGDGTQCASAVGGAGGAGWYGGASGNSFLASNRTGVSDSRGGGGGSSYTNPELCSDVIHTQGYSEATGNGWIILTPVK